MAILQECQCHRKQALSNKRCPTCGANMDTLKKAGKVRFHIAYREGGRKKQKSLAAFEGMNPYSLEDANKIQAKHTVAKERKLEIFERRPEDFITFKELASWYL